METMLGRKIIIYMINGTPTGPKTIEIGNWSGKAIYTPRANLKSVLSRPELESPGVYLLRSESSDANFEEKIYIGEAEKLSARLAQHSSSKDFESAICFVSKDEMLTKSHVKYLESRLVALARDARRSQVDNKNTPPESRLSEADISDMEYFLEQIKLILPAVGMNTLVTSTPHAKSESKPAPSEDVYYIKSDSVDARMVERDDAFVVLEGSQARLDTTESIAPGWLKIRNKLISDGVLVAGPGYYTFTEDTSFSSPSAASSVILGRQAPGPISWRTSSGMTYKDAQEALVVHYEDDDEQPY